MTRNQMIVTSGVMLGLFLASIEGTIVNTAEPSVTGWDHPIFQIEGTYETQASSTPKVWAAQFMYAALGGGIGGMYGNSYVNRFWRTECQSRTML